MSQDELQNDTARREARARLLANLEEAVKLAAQLNRAVSKAFPEAAKEWDAKIKPTLAGLSDDKLLALGDKAVSDLKETAFKVAPEAAIDSLEEELPTDEASKAQTDALMGRLRA
jgi:hypothetical protein